jgi:adenylyl-sulfate kinase
MSTNIDIQEYLDQDQKKDLLRLLTAGSVDDGKSTLIGRLLFDSKKLYDDQLSALERDSKRVGNAGEDIDYALLLDGLKAEREQGITIDVAYRYFSTNKRKFIIADTPGHEQYTRNMVTGASTANLAIILIDARYGVITQTKRHTFIASLLGIKHVVLAVNKMDLVDFDQDVFNNIVTEYKEFVSTLNIPDIYFVPLSALKGDNVVEKSDRTPWYDGKSLLDLLETVHVGSDRNFDDFRFPVQYVIRPTLDYRAFSGKISSGIVRKGDPIMVLPSRKVSKVKSIDTYDGELDYAFPPQSVSIRLEDEIDVSRGDMLVHPDSTPKVEKNFEAMLVWMDEEAMDPSTNFFIKHNTSTTKARIEKIQYRVDVNTLEKHDADHMELNEISRVLISSVKPLNFDPYRKNRQTGSFVLIDPVTHNTVAVGMIIDKRSSRDLTMQLSTEQKEQIVSGEGLISTEDYQKRYQQKASTIWFTGLHGSGKNHLAYQLERKLFDLGATVVLFDGKSTRSGLSKELDFSPRDRAEHLRRVAAACKLLNDKGIMAICTFISPDDDERNEVSGIIGKDNMQLIHMDATVEFARGNDKYGLYEKADNGDIINFAGIDINYQKPQNADLTIDASTSEDHLELVMNLLEEKGIFPL